VDESRKATPNLGRAGEESKTDEKFTGLKAFEFSVGQEAAILGKRERGSVKAAGEGEVSRLSKRNRIRRKGKLSAIDRL